jgi:alpha-glucosidase
MKLILDFVPNHSSDRHPSFLDSRSSRDGPKRDWYIWRDPKLDGGPPNNWVSNFGGPAWAFDEASGQFYLHSFLRGARPTSLCAISLITRVAPVPAPTTELNLP